jgi:glycosyltransferase involved in cell wall biosynthesis
MSEPVVTVTIPTYNRARLLPRTIESVLTQSIPNLEVFVSDNASTDATSEVVAEFGDPRLHYLRNDRNLGHFANLSRGLHLGSSPYVVVLPDDDVMLPGHLEHMLGILEGNPAIGFAHAGFKMVTSRPGATAPDERLELPGGERDHVLPGSTVVRRILDGSYYVTYPTAVFRRALLGPTECFAELDRGADDVGLSLRLARRAALVAYSAAPRVAVALHPGAQNTRAGGQEIVDGRYTITFRSVDDVKRAKLRFLDDPESDFPDRRALRAAIRRRARGSALRVMKAKSEPRRFPWTVGRQFVEATRTERTVLIDIRALRYLASSLAGRAGRDAFGRRRAARLPRVEAAAPREGGPEYVTTPADKETFLSADGDAR